MNKNQQRDKAVTLDNVLSHNEDAENEDYEEDAEDSDDEEESEVFICENCNEEFDEEKARCPNCNAWGALKSASSIEEEESEEDAQSPDNRDRPRAVPIDQVPTESKPRVSTGIIELDRVLGGGAVLGGSTLIGGDPGVGKSTLLLQALATMSGLGTRTLYITGEESAIQVALRARRIQNVVPSNLFLISDTNLDNILEQIERIKPVVMVCDSVQAVNNSKGPAGTPNQVKAVTTAMNKMAKRYRISTFIIGHVTKDGDLAGPKTLEHDVDTVLAFEGERGQSFRTLRTLKNRYGSSTEVGIFEMTAEGMRGVPNASEFFLAERNLEANGSVIAATSESNHAMLVEVQALVGNPEIGGGNVTCNGIDRTRLDLVIAVLKRVLGGEAGEAFALGGRDIFVNIAGGIKITEPALDLPIALAIASSLFRVTLPSSLVAFGEIGLTGEIRGVARVPVRLAEADNMGFEKAIVPSSVGGSKGQKKSGKGTSAAIDVLPVRTLEDALDAVKLLPPPAIRIPKKKGR